MVQRAPRYDVPNAAPGRLRLVQQFVNTTDHGHGRELLASPEGLRAWLGEHGLNGDPVGGAALVRARAVREALRTMISSGRPGPELDDAARRARLTIDFDTRRLVPTAPGIDGALGTILAAVYDAIGDGSWQRLKTCPNCRWAFWDASRNRSAAWCSMQLCGNRLKVRRHRDRARRSAR
jgi:predicted RNA-binding Zn ribbon-like protein